MKQIILAALFTALLSLGIPAFAQEKKADKGSESKKKASKAAEGSGSVNSTKGSNEREHAAEAKEVPPARPVKDRK